MTTTHLQAEYAHMPTEKVHRCAVTHCTRHTLRGFVACKRHWEALPYDIRQDLAAAFRQREQRPELHAEAVAVAERLVNLAAAGAA